MGSRKVTLADYGLDAPEVVRVLFILGTVSLLLAGSTSIGLWSGQLLIRLSSGVIQIRIASLILGCGISLYSAGCYMVWYSRVGKIWGRERLLGRLAWSGEERVLDLGCGRGLLLVGAARQLTTGCAIGVDIWQLKDLSGNWPWATLENARREGVERRVAIATADIRALPFVDETFDVVVSRATIHNLPATVDRARAIREIARVLKPGGKALIQDIRHIRQYAAIFAESGCIDIQHVGSWLGALLSMLVTIGSVRPDTLFITK